MKPKNVLVVFTKPVTKEDKLTLAEVKLVLSDFHINSKFVQRRNLKKRDFSKRDLVITIGGDGTFLRAALFIKDKKLILGVNADCKMKEGFFLACNRKNFRRNIKKFLDGKFKVFKLARLNAFINNKKIPDLALNEFYVGSDREYITSRYYLQIGHIKERHKSSGLLIATPSGSNAWISSCGGKRLNILARKFEYVVREPYKGKINGNYKLKKGVLKEGHTIKIISDMSKGFLIADSLGTEHFFKKNDKIKIMVSEKDLHVVFFN